MPGWLPRAMVLALVLVGCYQLTNWAFHQLLGLLTTLLVSLFLSLAIEPAVDRMAALGMRRGAATGLVFVVLFLATAGFVTAVGSLLVDQFDTLIGNLPGYVDAVTTWVNEQFGTDVSVDSLLEGLSVDASALQGYAQTVANNAWGVSASVLGGVFQVFTVSLFTFYLTADGPRLRRTVCSLFPPARQAEVLRAWEIAIAKTGGYLYSRGLMAIVSALAHLVLMGFLDVPYALALAIWVGLVSQFIPTVGTYLAGVLPVLVAFTAQPIDALWVLVFIVSYQQFENYVLQPRITARTVAIHPAVAFGAVIAGAALLGPTGALIAIPAAATLQGFLSTYVRRYEVVDPRAGGDGADERAPRRPGAAVQALRRARDWIAATRRR
nr:AI-2E family transporter [Allostreptomyces psammosilenae]